MKQFVAPLMLGFGVTLALIVGQRMSADAMAVVIGVAVGVAASVPTSLLLVALMRKDRRSWQAEQANLNAQAQPPAFPQYQQPPVIVLNPADLWNGRNGQAQPQAPMLPPEYAVDGGLRRLRVVGDED
jgi:hypothetical protein